MVTWEELEREARRKQEAKKREEEAARQEAERQRQIAEQKTRDDSRREQDLEARIKRTETERWGTPEKAYNTWEQRARAFVDINNNLVDSLKQQAIEARRMYSSDTFPVYTTRLIPSGFFGPKNKYVNEKSGTVSVSEFSYRQSGSDPQYYELTLNGTSVTLNNEISWYGIEVHLESHNRLREILYKIFEPEIQARLLQKDSPFIKSAQKFFELGQSLKKASRYSFECSYPRELEDKSTDLRFDNVTVEISNPVKFKAGELILPSVYITMYYHEKGNTTQGSQPP